MLSLPNSRMPVLLLPDADLVLPQVRLDLPFIRILIPILRFPRPRLVFSPRLPFLQLLHPALQRRIQQLYVSSVIIIQRIKITTRVLSSGLPRVLAFGTLRPVLWFGHHLTINWHIRHLTLTLVIRKNNFKSPPFLKGVHFGSNWH